MLSTQDPSMWGNPGSPPSPPRGHSSPKAQGFVVKCTDALLLQSVGRGEHSFPSEASPVSSGEVMPLLEGKFQDSAIWTRATWWCW